MADRTGRINAFIIGGVLLNALFIFLVPLGFSVLLCVLLLGVTIGGWPGAIMALPNQILSLQSRSTGFGVFYMVFYGIVVAFVPVAGWLRDFTGEETASLQFGGVLMILTVAALIVFRILRQRWFAEEPGQLLETTS